MRLGRRLVFRASGIFSVCSRNNDHFAFVDEQRNFQLKAGFQFCIFLRSTGGIAFYSWFTFNNRGELLCPEEKHR